MPRCLSVMQQSSTVWCKCLFGLQPSQARRPGSGRELSGAWCPTALAGEEARCKVETLTCGLCYSPRRRGVRNAAEWMTSRGKPTQMLTKRAYRTEIDPNQAQHTQLLKSCGVARFAYNWGLARRQAHYEEWKTQPEEMRGKYKPLSHYDLKKEWNARKAAEFPWASEVSTHCMQSAMADLDRAFQNFFRRLKQGGKPGFPRFKSRKKGLGGFRLYGCIHVAERHIQLPTFGLVRLKEHGYFPTEGIKILNASVHETAGRWFVSLQVEQEVETLAPVNREAVGVDVGVKSLAVLSDGTVFENPKPLRCAQRKLRRLQRSLSRKVKGSNNRKKAGRRVARLHYRVTCIRKNALHQASHAITKRYGVIGIEDLNVKGMVRNHCLAQAISDASFAELRRQITYKAGWRGGQVVLVDRWHPSSKICSGCGALKETLKLSERVYHCTGCGLEMDRDANAAVNLRLVAAKAADTLNARLTGEVQEQAPVPLVDAGTLIGAI